MYLGKASVSMLRFTFDVGTLVADKHYGTRVHQDSDARRGEHDKLGKERSLGYLQGCPRRRDLGRRSRTARPRHGLDCSGKGHETASSWLGMSRERRSTEPDKACQDQHGEQAKHLLPCVSSWRRLAEACAADMSDSSLPELSRHHQVRRCTAFGRPLATRATHLPDVRMAPTN
jgi:hypothetical protein